MPTQPFNPLGQLLCALLDISKSGVVIDGEWSLFDGSIHGLGELDGVAKPGLRRLFVRWRDASESQQLSLARGEFEVTVTLERTKSITPIEAMVLLILPAKE